MSHTLSEWLRRHDLVELEPRLVENDVDLKALLVLTESDLKELGLGFGPRKRLLNAIAEWKRTSAAAPGTTRTPWGSGAGGERRQLTVLFCDMVGFTQLASQLDPEVLQSIIASYEARCAECITRYEGYVFQRLGDGIVAFFGYPLAHEGEAERAIRAGLDIVRQLALLDIPNAGRLQVRIGIATGVVVVSGNGEAAAGETMNLAARLQASATPGQIVISDRVRRLAGGAFDYADLGLLTLKGIAQPMAAFRVVGIGRAVSRFDAATQQGVTPIVGRTPELARLQRHAERARRGQGQFVLLSGDPGIGKSRIVSTLRDDLQAAGFTLQRFQCSPFHVDSAFFPLIDYFHHALKFEPDTAPEPKLDRLEALVANAGRPATDARFLATLLSIPGDERYGPSTLPPRRQKEETLATLVAVIAATGAPNPSLFIFEDLHWADPSTLDLLTLLIQRARALPFLGLFTSRGEFQPPWAGHDHFGTLNLARLDRSQSELIVAQLTGGKSLPPELLDEIIVKTEGVPLFVEELTRSVLESGSLRDEGGRYVYSQPASAVQVPATLRDSLMARLDRLASAREIAQIGATIGREFSYELLSAVAALSDPALEEGLERLTESGLAHRHGANPKANYTFKHALVQDVAYDSLLKSRRQELHGRIASVLEERFPATADGQPELIARHYAAALRPEQAIPFWQRAGERSLQRFAMPEALAHFSHGLTQVGALPAGPARDARELKLRTLMAPAVVAKYGWANPEVCRLLEPALALTRSLQHQPGYLPVLHGLWVHFMSAGRHDVAMDWARELLAIAGQTGDGDIEIVAHRTAMTSNFWLGELSASQRHGERIRALYDPERHRHIAAVTNNDPLTADGSYRAQYLWMLGFPDQAVVVSDAKDEHARRRAHPFDLGFALTVGALVFDYRGEPAELLRRAEEAEQSGREHSIPLMSETMAQIVKGIAWLRAGRAAESVGQLQTSIARLTQTGHRAWVPYCRACLAEAMALAGDAAAALHEIEESLGQIERQSERSHYAEVLRLKGWILGELGREPEAEAALRHSISFARQQGARSWELRAATTLARRLVRRGDVCGAHALISPVHASFTEGFATRDLREAAALLEEIRASFSATSSMANTS